MKDPLPIEPDILFGTQEQMLAWCEREEITPRKDADGAWDWMAAWDEWQERQRRHDGDGI